MDATTLRIVLFVLGVAFLAGIYFYETARRRRESAQARRRVVPKMEPSLRSDPPESSRTPSGDVEEERDEGGEIEAAPSEEPLESPAFFADRDKDDEFDEFAPLKIDDEAISELETPGVSEVRESESRTHDPVATEPAMEQQELFSFSAREEASPVDVPDLILQINLRAHTGHFSGNDILEAMAETGLQPSGNDGAVFQRLASDGSREFLYNVASMVEPGLFPLREMARFDTPGLTLFTQLSGTGEGMMIFTDMLDTAERLGALLGGDLQDESHSALTKQTIEHLRERVLEHKRQIQLARRKG